MLIEYVSHGAVSGYGEAGRRLAHGLEALGVDVRLIPIRFDVRRPLIAAPEPAARADFIVVHSVPEMLPFFQARANGVPIVAHTVWEWDVLQPHWPDLLNGCAAVVVPTEWNAATFRDAGVHVPVAVVPHAAAVVEPDGRWLEPLRGKFVVHSIASWTVRKAPWLTVEAFARAFGPDDDATLVLRTDAVLDPAVPSPDGPKARRRLTSWTVASILHRHAPTGQVQLVHDIRTAGEIAALHRRSDCWLSLPESEGWNVGAFDAAAAGTPVVTTDSGGPRAYLDHARFVTDVEAAVVALRAVHADPVAARAAAAPQAEHLRRRYAPDVVAREFLAALNLT